MKLNKILASLVLTVMVGSAWAQSTMTPLWQGHGRIAISSDGNEHDDDDWSATPFSLAMLAAAGLQDKVTLYTYSDHIWGNNGSHPMKNGRSAYEQMRESALGGKRMFKFDDTKFICAVDNAEVAYTAMRDEINKSTEVNPLIIVAAGPMQVVGEALSRANKDALKHVTLLSHSYWNDTHADNAHGLRPTSHRGYEGWDQHNGWTWKEMKETFEKDGVKFVHIKDQNGKSDDGNTLYSYRKHFDWVKNSEARHNPYYMVGSWDWLYSRLEVCVKGRTDVKDNYDISDAGMIVYLLTGNDDANLDNVKRILENPCQPLKW